MEIVYVQYVDGWTRDTICGQQGCGLGRDVSVSRWSRDVLTSRLEAICLGLGAVGPVSGLGPLRLVESFCAGARRA